MNSAWTKEELVIISEIITGGSLKNYLSRLRQPRLKLIKQWCRGILTGLDYLHSQKAPIIHGDLTPDNIFIMSCDGTVKISDSYMNKLVNSSSTILGKPEYIAPEIFKGDYNAKADIYSFGMNLLEMCTQQPPYKEHLSSSKIYQCIKSSILPKAIETIKDLEIVELIRLCLADCQIRPSARELLKNKALDISENPKNYLPVPISRSGSFRSSGKDTSKIHISLIIKFHDHSPKDISFDYNTNYDSPEKVAKEMVENLKLDHNLIIKIAEEIERKLETATFEMEKDLKIQVFKYRSEPFEPKTASQVIEIVPLEKTSSSFDEENEVVLSKFEHVKSFQRLLSQNFATKLNCNGHIGTKTIMFIKKFQHQEGLVPNGIVSEELFKLLTHRIKESKN